MNYREKQKKTSADKKVRKISSYRKKYEDVQTEKLLPVLDWEERADRQIEERKEKGVLLPKPGEELFMTGWVGAAGTGFLADWKKEQLCTRFPEAFVCTVNDREVFTNFRREETEADLPEFFLQAGASWIAPVGEGGLMKTLYRFGKETGLGFRVQAGEVPVRQITIEFCEYFLLHPWELLTGRSVLFAAEHTAPVLEKLEKCGISFRKIGVVTKDRQKLICHGEEESNINRPEPDGVLTLLLEDKKQ